MLLDKDLIFSQSQAVTVSAPSTTVLNTGAAGDAYKGLFAVVQTREAVTSGGGNATVTFAIQTSSDNFVADSTTLATSGAIPQAQLTANSENFRMVIPPGAKKYLRMYYTVANGPLTAGKFDAFLVMDVQSR